MKVAIIGAGVAGLSAAKNSLQNGLDVEVFELSDKIGGTWVYTDDIDVHSSMYKGLVTNLPKEIMGFPDFPFPERDESYIPAHDVLAFLESYADHFNLNEKIRFKHSVIRVRPFLETQWEIIVKDLTSEKYITKIFDIVFVCNGHYHTPSIPKYPGAETFLGKQIHSHDFRGAEDVKEDSILVVGAGASGFDIAMSLSKAGKRVTLSHHLKFLPGGLPSSIKLASDIAEIHSNSVTFSDGSSDEYNLILYCTGYEFTFPFLSCDSGISVNDNYVQPLFKHCLNIKKPSMGIIGLPFKVCVTQMIDLQVRFCLQYFTGKVPLPSREEMLADTQRDMKMRWERGFKTKQAHMLGDLQRSYYDDLSSTAGVENVRRVMTNIYDVICKTPFTDINNFRKNRYRILDDENFVKVG